MTSLSLADVLKGPIFVSILLGLLGTAVFLAIWTFASHSLGNAVLLPSPLSVLDAYGELIADGSLITDVRASIVRVFGGFLLASSLAVPLALLLAYSRILRGLVMPLIALIRPIPPIAWIPLAILWMGLGDPPSYFITAIAAFFPIFLNSFARGVACNSDAAVGAPHDRDRAAHWARPSLDGRRNC
jgi:NitT/TauT family transport system permease protein